MKNKHHYMLNVANAFELRIPAFTYKLAIRRTSPQFARVIWSTTMFTLFQKNTLNCDQSPHTPDFYKTELDTST
jgi:hypothetical protein